MARLKLVYFLFVLILLSQPALAQVNYAGPAQGSVASGVIVSTDNFTRVISINDPTERATRNVIRLEEAPHFVDFGFPMPEEGSNYVGDLLGTEYRSGTNAQTVLLNDFQGIPQTNSIPPDPHVAVGPNHIIATVNSRFAIWDKEGNLLKNIDADAWYNSILPNPGAFDPKVCYDHHDNRWIMVWLSQSDANQTGYFLLSVSDDDDPLGVWYNWALPSHLNGSNFSGGWGDYQGVGFDKDAIYITSNQFSFAGGFQNVKLRTVPKAQLYANTAGQVIWQDIWNISRPASTAGIFTLRPSITYGTPDRYYLIWINSSSSNAIGVYNLRNPLTTPILDGVNVFVTPYSSAPNANQLGGSTILVEGGGSALRHEPIFRDGYLWAVHSVRNQTSPSHSAIQYLKVDVSTNLAVEDYVYGAPGYWHIYNTLAVDKDHNVAITFSRSGDTEYIGAFYTTRLANDPPGFEQTYLLRPGQGNYVKDFGSGRNRWGDYNGIWVDPVDQNNFWLFTEYVHATNTWGTWTGQIRLVPFTGPHLYTRTKILDFGNIEVGQSSSELTLTVSNYGDQNVTITSIPSSSGNFEFASNITFPYVLQSYDSLDLSFKFTPQIRGTVTENYPINSNDPNFTSFTLRGNGFVITPTNPGQLFASSGIQNSGEILTVDASTGAGTPVGPSLFNEVRSISVHPVTGVIYGLVDNVTSTSLVRVNAEFGDAYNLYNFSFTNSAAIAFDTTGNLYASSRTGTIYQIDLNAGTFQTLFETGLKVAGLAFNPVDNSLWATNLQIVGSGKDKVYKINVTNGDTLFIGNTGFNVTTNDIAFDAAGNLFGITGAAAQISNLISISTQDGVGTLIGAVGYKNLVSLGYNYTGTTSVDGSSGDQLPTEFGLMQNYPNPFNPSTTIKFSLPEPSNVKVVIYNMLGEVVNILYDGMKPAGYHNVVWNSDDLSGRQVSSGVYFYELRAASGAGKEYQQIKKMVFMK